MNELALVQNNTQLVTEADSKALRNSKFKNFTDSEIQQCLRISEVLKLHPLLNQIHFVKRKSKDGTTTITTQVGIDGFRLAAERSGAYAGSDDAIFEYKDTDKVRAYPTKATVTVYKIIGGVRCPFTASARWDEYYPGGVQGVMWDNMPHNQLAKCAEALALRKGFPAELSSFRSDEEMAQADTAPKAAQEIEKKVNAQAESAPIETTGQPVAKSDDIAATSQSEIPVHCGKPMRISKFVDRNFGHKPYWCTECNEKVAAE